MKQEHFKSELEYKNKYPSGLYICSNCRTMTTSSTYCQNCNWSANGLFKTMNKGFVYSIGEGNSVEIFQPIEMFENQKERESNESSNKQ